jgi:glycerol-3-phosphate cytidylyltransferase-like family protein
MDPELLTGSMMLRTANLVVGEHVHMMKFKNRILYMERERIINMVSCVDKIVSLNPWVIESGDLSRVLLQHVNGGFI